jgi:hypothetical protein
VPCPTPLIIIGAAVLLADVPSGRFRVPPPLSVLLLGPSLALRRTRRIMLLRDECSLDDDVQRTQTRVDVEKRPLTRAELRRQVGGLLAAHAP